MEHLGCALVKLLVVLLVLVQTCCSSIIGSGRDVLFNLRGGLVPQATEDGNYYEQYSLDYGGADNARNAGSLRGFIKIGSLVGLPQSDAFLKWLYDYMENGPEPIQGRIKAYHVSV